MTYLITFACYGTRVHGDELPSVDRKHNLPGSPMLEPNFGRGFAARRLMDQRAYTMDQSRRDVVLAAIVERCSARGWSLLAAHVRSNHVHVVVDSEQPPERVMNDLKSYASRFLNNAGLDDNDRKRWARHGSTRRLYDRDAVDSAVMYVIDQQGDPMAIYCAPDRC